MSGEKLALTILVVALVTLFTRAFPFFVFRSGQKIPPAVVYIGRYLPPAIITIIVVYCFKPSGFMVYPYGVPTLVAGGLVALLHIWKHNFLLSILGGTFVYIVIVQYIM